MKRAEVLEAAKVCVCGEREHDYGTPEDNFTTIGLLWGVYLRAAHPEVKLAIDGINAKDVATMMALLRWPASPPAQAQTALWTWRAMRPVPVRSPPGKTNGSELCTAKPAAGVHIHDGPAQSFSWPHQV
jgi:hypothetical protein